MNEQVIEKLKKILRLANNDAATEGEVKAAMARAKEIAMQHDIDLAQLDHSDPNAKAKQIEIDKNQVAFATEQRYYHRCISHVVKEVFGIYVVRVGNAYAFIGDKHDIVTAKEIFIWLEEVFPRSFRQQVERRNLRQCAADRNGFYDGFAEGLLEVNRKAVRETLTKQNVDGNKYAMVLRSKEQAIALAVPKFFPSLQKGRCVSRQYNSSANGLGYQEGRKVTLRQTGSGAGAAAGQLR